MTDKKGADRRRDERHEVKDRIFITFRPQFERIGWLTDISKGGVSFEYPTFEEYSALPEKIHVDIFSSPRNFNLSNLPCKLVYETPVDKAKGFMGTIGTRRCGLVFEAMSEHQAAQLATALSQHT